MARAPTVDHHRIGGSVEHVEVNPLGQRGVPVVDVKGHRAAVRMSQADAVSALTAVAGFSAELHRDLAGRPRVLELVHMR